MIQGGYHDNMRYVIKKNLVDLNTTYFAMGIDATSEIRYTTTKGILRDVCTMLREDYHITQDSIQSRVNEAINYLDHNNSDQKGDVVFIEIPIKLPRGEESNINLALIANSQHRLDVLQQVKDRDLYSAPDPILDEVEYDDPRLMIISLFNKCKRNPRCETLFLPAIGTNLLGAPYEVITAEIMSSYIIAVRDDLLRHKSDDRLHNLKNVYFSVRDEDMERNAVSMSDIHDYVKASIDFLIKP